MRRIQSFDSLKNLVMKISRELSEGVAKKRASDRRSNQTRPMGLAR